MEIAAVGFPQIDDNDTTAAASAATVNGEAHPTDRSVDVNVTPLHRRVPEVIAEARNLLAGLMDADLPPAAALAVCQAYNHLESADDGLWPPPQTPHISDLEVALGQVQGLLRYAVDHPGPRLDPYDLGRALRETAAAIVLTQYPGGAA